MDQTERPVKIPPSFGLYAEKHAIHDLYKRMLCGLVASKPNDPIAYMIEYLQRDKDDVPHIVVLGPPLSGKTTIATLLSKELGAVLITADNLKALPQKSPRSNRSSPTLASTSPLPGKGGALTPRAPSPATPCADLSPQPPVGGDNFSELITTRLKRKDVVKKGWIMADIPSTREQQITLIDLGIFPKHCIILEGDDSMLLQREAERYIDPRTGAIYHKTFDWPALEKVRSRLVQTNPIKRDDLIEAFASYHRNMVAIKPTYIPFTRVFDVNQPKSNVFSLALTFACQPTRTSAPFTPRVLLLGPPGSGRGLLASMICKKYQLANVKVGLLINAAIAADSEIGQACNGLIQADKPVSTELKMKIVEERLSKPDSSVLGWVMRDFPSTIEEAKLLADAGFIPNRIFLLKISDETVEERLALRATDPITGQRHHLLFNPAPSEKVKERLLVHPNDKIEAVHKKLADWKAHINSIEEYYKDSIEHINADQDIHTVFETLETMLLNSTPVCAKP